MRWVIADAKNLESVVAAIRGSSWIAVDSEADSLHAYPEKLCLLQFSTECGDYLVDTLAGMDLTGLLDALRNRELIFHGADYDLRMLRKTFHFVPSEIFDTMTAARLLGYQQFGLGHLVERHLGVTLEKGPQKMNWARRPLTERMEQYARNDTRHLKPLSDQLRAELKNKGRLTWQMETCQQLIIDCADVPTATRDQWRMKGSDRLTPRGLAVLRELWKWREKEAIAANKPPFFVLNHDLLLRMAHESERIRNIDKFLPPRMSPRRREAILIAIAHAQNVPESDLPTKRTNVLYQPTVEEQKRFTALRQVRDKKAAELEIDPTLIASRSTLVLLSQDWDKYKADLMNWQRELLTGAV
ncbi:MAG TPA: HRDC domain-containing protein [Verrucomicrobiae bacterium]